MATKMTTNVTGMTQADARILTDKINQTADQLWRLLLEAYERKAWAALGYASWREYGKAEFSFSQGHLYRLLDQGRVIRALEQAADSPIGEIIDINEHVARQIKPEIDTVTDTIKEQIAAGETPKAAVERAVSNALDSEKEIRRHESIGRYLESRKAADRDNRIIASMAIETDYWMEGVELVDFDALDEECAAFCAQKLRQASREILHLAARLEKRAKPNAA